MKYLYSYRLQVPRQVFDVSSEERKDEEILNRLITENGDNLISVAVYEEKETGLIELGVVFNRKMKDSCNLECFSCERKKS